MVVLNGYELDENKWTVRGGGGQCNIAFRNDEKLFIKRPQDPKYPGSELFDTEYIKRKLPECEKWFSDRMAICDALNQTSDRIIVPLEYFRDGCFYYEVSRYEELSNITASLIREDELREVLLYIAEALAELHRTGIVHGDIDISNVAFLRKPDGRADIRLIDLTDAFFAGNPPDLIRTKELWMSPETAVYNKKKGEDKERIKRFIGCKSDIFSLGLLFHKLCSSKGKLPECNGKIPCMVFFDKQVPVVDKSIPQDLGRLISRMMAFDPDERPDIEEICEELKCQYAVQETVKQEPAAVAAAAQIVEPDDVRAKKLNDLKVKVFFPDGRTKIMDIWLAEKRGYYNGGEEC